ncbi:ERAD-associated E3 ubiquitin-protein ligase HRD1B isoform X2 [Morus notabilis]|uniref:ERAD-associated E3 ubiquitin-protein ligase HRD1B isoform X2 n=1 Tax=Morus notabilis TaxID=981085 RepID=UPI000CED159F|nr:ERAD-associated E3 ubiquitin-protein ligase HRD1B isoform X2 [Morus notabilis]
MIRLQTYAGLSFVATLAVIYHAFNSRGQFYPAMVYLSTSKISLVLLLNMGLVIMCILWQLTKRVFLGSLREAEVERLNEQSWREVMEILFAITIFRQDFSVSFLAMVTALLLIKALHWLAQKRVEYIETTPAITVLSHIRIVSFLGFLLTLDSLFLYTSVNDLIRSKKASVSLFFSFEYMILATTTVSTFVKYVFYVSDMLMEGQWEKKPVYTFYLELIRDLLHLSMYLCFFLVIFMNYGVPLHLIRELYETFRNFKIRVADYIRYRKITSNMNDRFPDATPEELNATDAICIICREEMTTAKKLICGHLFHVHCLRSWLERQHTCPTCRALVVPPEDATSVTGGQNASRSEAHQGTGISGSSLQGSANSVAGENVSHHQARLQAAAAAAAIYERSYVYPSANAVVWHPGSAAAFLPQAQIPFARSSSGAESSGEPASSAQAKQFVPFGDPANMSTYLQRYEDREAQRKLIQHQMEILQHQLQLLQNPKANEDTNTEAGLSFGSSQEENVASVSECDHHGKID